jgi:hypothetical protein
MKKQASWSAIIAEASARLPAPAEEPGREQAEHLICDLNAGKPVDDEAIAAVLQNLDWFDAAVTRRVGRFFSRAEAVMEVMENAVLQWNNDHPPEGNGMGPDAWVCVACAQQLGRIGLDATPRADGSWLHDRCEQAWAVRQRRTALVGLLQEAQANASRKVWN